MPRDRTKNERAAVGEIVIARGRMLSALVAAAKPHDAALEGLRDGGELAGAAISGLVPGLERDLASAVEEGRSRARSAGRRRLKAELASLGAVASLTTPSVLDGIRRRELHDSVAAWKVAGSLGDQWRAIALLAAGRDDDKLVGRAFVPRLSRVAATESALAYNDEHRAVAAELASRDPEVGKLLREWTSLIDACPKCWDLDGERAPLDDSYPSGLEPGTVHPHCQCAETLVAA